MQAWHLSPTFREGSPASSLAAVAKEAARCAATGASAPKASARLRRQGGTTTVVEAPLLGTGAAAFGGVAGPGLTSGAEGVATTRGEAPVRGGSTLVLGDERLMLERRNKSGNQPWRSSNVSKFAVGCKCTASVATSGGKRNFFTKNVTAATWH